MQNDLGRSGLSNLVSRIHLKREAPLLCIAACLSTNLFPDATPPWQVARQQAIGAAKLGHFDQAVATLRAAIGSADQQSVEAVTLWNELGAVHHGIRDPQADFHRALALNATLRHPDVRQTAISLNNLGTSAGERRDAPRAKLSFGTPLSYSKPQIRTKQKPRPSSRGILP